MFFVESVHLKSQGSRKVFFIPKHHTPQRRKPPVRLLGLGLPSNGFPKRRTVVQVVGDDGPSPLRRGHSILGDRRSGRRKRTIDSAGMEPARAVLAENLLPVDFAGFQLRNGGMPAIGTSQRRAQAKAS